MVSAALNRPLMPNLCSVGIQVSKAPEAITKETSEVSTSFACMSSATCSAQNGLLF